MALALYIVPYERVTNARPVRRCAMDRYTATITADAGDWREVEFLGNRALVKVRASVATLNAIDAAEGWFRIPVTVLDTPLANFSAGQRTALRNQITGAGYTLAELNAQYPDLAVISLRQALVFLTKRRLKARYDVGTDTIVCDGVEQQTGTLQDLDDSVQ